MKKKIIIGICAILLLASVIYYNSNTNIKNIVADRKIIANNVAELNNESDLIIKATVLPNKENILINDDNDGTVKFGYTVTRLKITQVLKGDISDETIKITEEYYTTRELSGKSIWTQGYYLPAKENKEYIFFLKKYADTSNYAGMYFPIDLEKGKYKFIKNLDTDSTENLSAKDLDISDKTNVKEYKEWYKEVMKEYKDQLKN